MKTVAKTFEELTNREVYEILKARSAVFMIEQRIVYLDMDDVDYGALHVFFEEDGHVTAYLRAYPAEEGTIRIGRVLTRERGTGLGRKIMEAGIAEIRKRFRSAVIALDSQCHAAGFYKKLGFRVCSEEFMEAGIPHVKMELRER